MNRALGTCETITNVKLLCHCSTRKRMAEIPQLVKDIIYTVKKGSESPKKDKCQETHMTHHNQISENQKKENS